MTQYAHEKSPELPTTPTQVHHAASRGGFEAVRKEYGTLQAEFAQLGYRLSRSYRAHDDRISYAVTRNGASRYFTHMHDLVAFFTAVVAASDARARLMGVENSN